MTHIWCIPVWASKCGALEGKEDYIILFDMYDKTTAEWLGSKRLLRFCQEFNRQYAEEA
jgi:hypothetical protein